MNNSLKQAVRIALIPAVFALGSQSGLAGDMDKQAKKTATHNQATIAVAAKQTIAAWPQTSREVARKMMREYGEPDGVTDTMLIWHENGPWLRTIVHRDEVRHNFPMPHGDVLEQFIRYEVPVDKFDDLARYDGSVVAYRTNGELSARCDTEGANFLALNLARDIIDGERTVDEARAHYARTMHRVMEGEQPEYVQGLQFKVQTASAAFADEPFEIDAQARYTYTDEQPADNAAQVRVSTDAKLDAELDADADAYENEGEVVLTLDQMSADDLEDRKVLALDGAIVGDVEGMGYSSAHGENVIIVEIGGVLGIGDKDVALPLSKLRLTPEGHIQTSWTELDFENAPDTEEDTVEGWDD